MPVCRGKEVCDECHPCCLLCGVHASAYCCLILQRPQLSGLVLQLVLKLHYLILQRVGSHGQLLDALHLLCELGFTVLDCLATLLAGAIHSHIIVSCIGCCWCALARVCCCCVLRLFLLCDGGGGGGCV